MLAGIYEPVIGRLRVKGSLNALLDPNLGMNMELTGRENILLRGLYNGLPRSALPRLEEDVAEFAELADFLDLPVRIYSAGMVVRLGFALATAIKPQILLMDEWFLAGDAVFMDKARQRLEEMVRGADILVLSSHQMSIVRNWCTRVLWLDQGQIMADGPTNDVLTAIWDRCPSSRWRLSRRALGTLNERDQRGRRPLCGSRAEPLPTSSPHPTARRKPPGAGHRGDNDDDP